eukprot:m.135894 g.135894  ORF g.135894 m.135894 type:complete len:267 (+) comp10295_c0_seq1:29-829(+)
MSYQGDFSLLSSSLWEGGPSPGQFYPMQNPHQQQPQISSPHDDPRQHTTHPIVTGTSVLAIKYKGGVAVAADTLGSYGSLARFRDLSRLVKVGDHTIVGGSGDIADFHKIRDYLNTFEIENCEADDGHVIKPKAVHSYLTRILYHRRSQQSPLWNSTIIAGFVDGDAYLGVTDKLGVAFVEETIATGYGAYIALPILRDIVEKNEDLSEEDAVRHLRDCMRVLWYRDARSLNRYEIATINSEGATIYPAESADSDWSIASMVDGYE